MKDYPMIFENIVRHFWSQQSNLEVYYANYFSLSDVKARGILYSILIYEINHKKTNYSPEILVQMEKFENMEWDLKNLNLENKAIVDFLDSII